MVSKPIAPSSASANGSRFVSTSCGIMIGHDDVDEPGRQTGDESPAFVFPAQRRREFQERPVIADVVFVECQMIDRGGAGDGQAIGLCLCDNVQGERRRDKRGVVARAGQVHEPDVAIEHDRLRLARDSRKAKARGEFAFVHHSFGGKIGVLGDNG